MVQSQGEQTTAAVQLLHPVMTTGQQENEHGTSLTFGGGGDDVLLSAAGASLTDSSSPAVNHPATAAPPSLNTTIPPSSTAPAVQHRNGNQCYFPAEYQGVYQVQSSIDPLGRVVYDQVEIGPQDISVWGTCHSLFGQHVLTHIR